MVTVELAALLVMLTVPLKVPDADGAKVTSNKAEFPLARIWPEERPPTLSPVPEIVTLEMDTFDPPVFVSVTGRMVLLPTATVPKLNFVVLVASWPATSMVNTATLLVTFPSALLTTALNREPLSEALVTGVS